MAATCPIDFDVASLRDNVRAVYTRVAANPTGDFHFHRGPAYAVERLGYDPSELRALPRASTERFAGVGNPLAMGAPALGETVLDHACGAGMDLLLAARRLGSSGRAIGVDMTPAMREQATLAAALAGVAERTRILPGLLEELPLDDASVDVVISNGVLNLSPDKRQALREVFRVLRPGGRLLLADVVVRRELTLPVRQSPELWAACIGGALPEPELLELVSAAGLRNGRVEARFQSFAGSSAEAKVSVDLELSAVNFSAQKPRTWAASRDQSRKEMHMNAVIQPTSVSPYQRVIAASKRARWDLDQDVLRGRSLEREHKYLPDGLSLAHTLKFLAESEQRFMSRVQGRSYANIFGLVERFINAKVLQLSQHHFFGNQLALEALVRFSDEELKHQELFRRIERLAAEGMPEGYRFLPNPNDVAGVVLARSSWSVLALTCHIELFTLAHYKRSIEPDASLSPLFKDVLLFHWKEESQHAVLDELEWRRVDGTLGAAERVKAVDDLLALVAAVDGILQLQAAADADYFASQLKRRLSADELASVQATFLRAYRYQYIGSGIEQTRFVDILFGLVGDVEATRIKAALAPLL